MLCCSGVVFTCSATFVASEAWKRRADAEGRQNMHPTLANVWCIQVLLVNPGCNSTHCSAVFGRNWQRKLLHMPLGFTFRLPVSKRHYNLVCGVRVLVSNVDSFEFGIPRYRIDMNATLQQHQPGHSVVSLHDSYWLIENFSWLTLWASASAYTLWQSSYEKTRVMLPEYFICKIGFDGENVMLRSKCWKILVI